jgi:hypothetical protein
MSTLSEQMGGLAYFLDQPAEWFATELQADEIGFVTESIGPISAEMEKMLYDLYSYYTSNDARSFAVMQYNYVEEDVTAFMVLPFEIFDAMWEYTTREYDLWNAVVRKTGKDGEYGSTGEWSS